MIGDGYMCDQCHKKEIQPTVVGNHRFVNGWPGLPAGWFSLTGPDVGWEGSRDVSLGRHDFCSMKCVADWSDYLSYEPGRGPVS